MAEKRFTRDECIALLQKKQESLNKDGYSRYPQRSDFEEFEIVAIKAFFGPWPRALEAAGLKPQKSPNTK